MMSKIGKNCINLKTNMRILMTKVTFGILPDNHNIILTRKSLAAENAFMSKV